MDKGSGLYDIRGGLTETRPATGRLPMRPGPSLQVQL